MRQITSFSLKEELLQKIRERIRGNSDFRSKSHLVEIAVEKYLKNTEK